MIGGAPAEEAGAAVRLLLNDGDARRNRGGAFWICGAKDSDDGKTDGGGDMHSAGIVAEEDVALGQECGEIGDGCFAGEVDGRRLQFGGDCDGDGEFARSAEKNDVGVGVREKGV
jgi:hypothetical protein